MVNKIKTHGSTSYQDFYKERIYMADSFVKPPQKLGKGNGEAKLYLGEEGKELRKFFGNSFEAWCFLEKTEVLQFLLSLETEYLHPTQNYRNQQELPILYKKRVEKVKSLDDKIWFKLVEQTQIIGKRIYAKSKEEGFNLLRELSLPKLSYLHLRKLKGKRNEFFHARLFTDFLPYPLKNQLKKNKEEEFTQKVLEEFPYCVVTKAPSVLEASNIKPEAHCNDKEKYDPNNGLAMTSHIRKLFDLGFISFNKNKLIMSEWLYLEDAQKLNVKSGMGVFIPKYNQRERYLKYHRDNIFKA